MDTNFPSAHPPNGPPSRSIRSPTAKGSVGGLGTTPDPRTRANKLNNANVCVCVPTRVGKRARGSVMVAHCVHCATPIGRHASPAAPHTEERERATGGRSGRLSCALAIKLSDTIYAIRLHERTRDRPFMRPWAYRGRPDRHSRHLPWI